jgi:hypothetical protein
MLGFILRCSAQRSLEGWAASLRLDGAPYRPPSCFIAHSAMSRLRANQTSPRSLA